MLGLNDKVFVCVNFYLKSFFNVCVFCTEGVKNDGAVVMAGQSLINSNWDAQGHLIVLFQLCLKNQASCKQLLIRREGGVDVQGNHG
jgi:hypothetical protein